MVDERLLRSNPNEATRRLIAGKPAGEGWRFEARWFRSVPCKRCDYMVLEYTDGRGKAWSVCTKCGAQT